MSSNRISSDSGGADFESESIGYDDDIGDVELPGSLEEAEYSIRLALSVAHDSLHESEILREELSTYVDDLAQRKDSEGGALLKVPSNFGAVLNSMTREDLLNESDSGAVVPPWSQYLLLDGLNAEGNTEFGGRYCGAFVDTPDVKIRRGLAQIEMLDRQLKETVKRDCLQRNDARISETDSIPDETFVTGQRSARRSPRFVDKAAPAQPSRTSTGRSDGMSANGEEAGRKWLLDLDGDAASREALEKHLGGYLDEEHVQRLKCVDEELARFGRMDRLRTDFDIPSCEGNDEGGVVQDGLGGGGKPDYLAEQRVARRAAAEAARLDNLIRQCTTQPIDYEALVDPASYSDRIRQNGGTDSTSLSEVPPLGLVQPARKVTSRHIRQLMEELLPATSVSDGYGSMNGEAAEVEEPTAHARAAIRHLVQQYKADVQALARARARAGTSPSSLLAARSRSPDLHIAAGAAQQEPEAEAQNWLLDWGEAVQPASVNASHPAVRLTGGQGQGQVQGGGGKRSPRHRPADPENNHALHAQTRGTGQESGMDRHFDFGWLPPLPPRSAEGRAKGVRDGSLKPVSAGGGQSRAGRNTISSAVEPLFGERQPRSPSKSLRLQTNEPSAAAVGSGAGSFLAGGHGYARQRGAGISSPRVQQSSREARASNVLNSMSAFLSREVLTSTTADQASDDSLRI